MGWLEGLVSGYTDRHKEIEAEHTRQAELAAEKEGRVYQALLNSSDPYIKSLAATGMLANTQPRKRTGGLGGWMGETEAHPVYAVLQKYLSAPHTYSESETVAGLPSTQRQGYLPLAPGQTPSMAQPTSSPTEGDAMATPRPLPEPSPAAVPPPTPPQLGLPAALGAMPGLVQPAPAPAPDRRGNMVPVQPPPPPPAPAVPAQPALAPSPGEDMIGPQETGAQTAPPTPATAPALATPPAPPSAFTTIHAPGGPVTRQHEVTRYPHAFQTAEEAQTAASRAKEQGDFLSLVEVGRRSGQADPEGWAAGLIAAEKQKAAGIHEGDARQLPDGRWVQDLYDNSGKVMGQIPAGAKGSGRAWTKRELIASALYGKGGEEDPNTLMKRLTNREKMSVLQEEGILAAEASLKRAEMLSDAPLSAQAKSTLIEQLNTKWRTLQKPQRDMGLALNAMQVGVNRFNEDRLGATQAVLVTFQKILDPTSVVRESEYDRTAHGLSVLNRLKGMYDRYIGQWDPVQQKWIGGGAGVPEEELRAMYETARQFAEGMNKFNDDERQRLEDRAAQNHIDPGYIFGGGVQPVTPGVPAPGASAGPPPAPAAPPVNVAPAVPTAPATPAAPAVGGADFYWDPATNTFRQR